MALEPWELPFRPSEQVSTFDFGPSLKTNTYLSKNIKVVHIFINMYMIHMGSMCFLWFKASFRLKVLIMAPNE